MWVETEVIVTKSNKIIEKERVRAREKETGKIEIYQRIWGKIGYYKVTIKTSKIRA